MRGDVAHAQVGRDGLRIAADVEHARQLVEAGERGTRVGVEVHVEVVLDDGQAVLVGQLQHAMQLRQRGGGSRRALQPRLREEHARVVRDDGLLQRREVVALRRALDRDQARAGHAQREQQVGVARVVHQHGVARAHEAADGQVQRVAGAVRQQHLVGLQRHLLLGQRVADPFAQRQVAARVAVAVQLDVLGGQAAQAAAHAVLEQPRLRQPAAARLHGQVAVLEDAAQVPLRVEAGRGGEAGHGRDLGGRAPPHEEARVRPRHQVALRHQPVVGLDDGKHAHLVRLGEVADRRDLRARSQAAVGDQAAQAVDDLSDQRGGGIVLQREHGAICTGTSTCTVCGPNRSTVHGCIGSAVLKSTNSLLELPHAT